MLTFRRCDGGQYHLTFLMISLGFWSVAVNTMERLQFLVLIINLYSLWVKFISWMTGSSVRYSMLQLVYFFLDNSVCTASLKHCCFRLNSWKSYCSTVSFTMRLLSASVAMNQYVTKTKTCVLASSSTYGTLGWSNYVSLLTDSCIAVSLYNDLNELTKTTTRSDAIAHSW